MKCHISLHSIFYVRETKQWLFVNSCILGNFLVETYCMCYIRYDLLHILMCFTYPILKTRSGGSPINYSHFIGQSSLRLFQLTQSSLATTRSSNFRWWIRWRERSYRKFMAPNPLAGNWRPTLLCRYRTPKWPEWRKCRMPERQTTDDHTDTKSPIGLNQAVKS